jgi:hypothetical protein
MFSRSTLTATVLAAGVALFASSPAWASGTTTYASPTGSTTADCSDSAQACGLQRAVNMAPLGGEVVLAPGTYSSGFPIQIPWQLNVHGQAGEPRPTILNDHSGCTDSLCSSDPAVVLNSPEGKLSHVRVVEAGGAPATPALKIINAADSEQETVEDVIAEGDDGVGILTEGDALIRDSVAWTPNTPANAAIYATLPSTLGTVHLRLENVTAVAPNAYGLQVYGGCQIQETCDVEVQMENSILRGGASDTYLGGYGSIEFFVDASHSNYRGVGYITQQGTNGNQTDEPQFVDAADGDFHQLETSPTRDAGVASPNLGPADIDGDSRSYGSAPDIGADEWVPATQPQPQPQPTQPQQPPVQQNQPPAQPQQPGAGSAGGGHSRLADAFRGVRLRGGTLHLRQRKLLVRVSCPRQAKRYCKGTLTLTSGPHRTRRGHAAFRLKPGRSKLVSVTVSRKLLKLRRFEATVTARARDAAGHTFATHTRVHVKRG